MSGLQNEETRVNSVDEDEDDDEFIVDELLESSQGSDADASSGCLSDDELPYEPESDVLGLLAHHATERDGAPAVSAIAAGATAVAVSTDNEGVLRRRKDSRRASTESTGQRRTRRRSDGVPTSSGQLAGTPCPSESADAEAVCPRLPSLPALLLADGAEGHPGTPSVAAASVDGDLEAAPSVTADPICQRTRSRYPLAAAGYDPDEFDRLLAEFDPDVQLLQDDDMYQTFLTHLNADDDQCSVLTPAGDDDTDDEDYSVDAAESMSIDERDLREEELLAGLVMPPAVDSLPPLPAFEFDFERPLTRTLARQKGLELPMPPLEELLLGLGDYTPAKAAAAAGGGAAAGSVGDAGITPETRAAAALRGSSSMAAAAAGLAPMVPAAAAGLPPAAAVAPAVLLPAGSQPLLLQPGVGQPLLGQTLQPTAGSAALGPRAQLPPLVDGGGQPLGASPVGAVASAGLDAGCPGGVLVLKAEHLQQLYQQMHLHTQLLLQLLVLTQRDPDPAAQQTAQRVLTLLQQLQTAHAAASASLRGQQLAAMVQQAFAAAPSQPSPGAAGGVAGDGYGALLRGGSGSILEGGHPEQQQQQQQQQQADLGACPWPLLLLPPCSGSWHDGGTNYSAGGTLPHLMPPLGGRRCRTC